jgi:predicted lipoprotein with Yx(FWY)xxD motif
MKRTSFLAWAIAGIVVLLTLLIPSVTGGQALANSSQQSVAKVAHVGKLGNILVTGKGFALYRWTKEKPGQIKCTGACAKVWPPLLLRAGASAPKSVSGVSGKFGAIVRPDKTRQLTYNGHALYTYVSDTKPGEALCQGAEGWYVLPIH